MKLIEKKIISGKIILETGLHIGGSKSSLEIGGIDSSVIKTAFGVPYVPGSSLKGKLRSLLAKEEGATEIKNESDVLKKIFGIPGVSTRLYVRDAYLDEKHFKENFHDSILDLDYTEEKVENVIDRGTGTTKKGGLRFIERVPAGAVFNFELVLNKYKDDSDYTGKIKAAFHLLEDDYLGGSGSRGYGKVKIDWDTYKVENKPVQQYFETS